jgi:hypothetical protein
MPDKEKEGAGLPIGGMFVILTILLGYFIIPDQPFKSSRQPTQDAAKSQVPERGHVEARLWEDPFAAVLRSKDYQSPGGDEYKLSILAGRIAEKILKTPDDDLLILGVMVFGGQYAESSEMRRRSRYAVLSALSEEGFSPDRPDRLAFLDLRGGDIWRSLEANPLTVMPYEFLSGPRPVVILWVNEDLLGSNPLNKLGIMANSLYRAVSAKTQRPSSDCRMKFKILGPAGSTTLQAMMDENPVPDIDETRYLPRAPFMVEFFCWGATADESFLLERHPEPDLAHVISKDFPVRFFRTIGTDRQLMDSMVEELRRRGVEPSSDHFALISEWDTIYGRTLSKTFARSAGIDENSKNIHRFTYMQGIDGQISIANEAAKAPESSSQGSKKSIRTEGIEKPEGHSQFDYLRRLARNLKRIDLDLGKMDGGIKAIGVLGFNIYDKLLVLQAIYDLFPGAIFFTTDLDARFLHPDELHWTRNLLISSSFGLNLHPALQKNTPPFRDSYQTSLFFTTRLALTPGLKDKNIKDCLSDFLRRPRIFEVGRNDAFDLFPETETGKDPTNPCDGLKSMWHKGSSGSLSIHPERSTGYLSITWSGLLRVIVMAVVFLAMIYLIAVRGWNVGKDTASSILIAIGAVVCLAAIAGVLFAVVHRQQAGGEPFGLLEGISIWPTVYLRLVAFMLSAGLIVTVCRRSRWLEGQLQGYFISAEFRDKEPAPDELTAGHSSNRPSEDLWRDYCRRKTLRARLKRVLGLAVPYAILCGMIIFAFGPLFVPFRGATSEKAHFVSLTLAIGAFIILLFWVVDATSMGVWLIKQIHKGYGGWSEKMKTFTAERFGVDAEEVNDWIGLEVIVKLTDTDNQFIYYPILVIILLGVSRLSYFDRWDMPPGLLIVILLGLGFSMSCAIRLRRKAEQFRKEVLTRLWEKQVRLAGEGNGSKGLSKKIDMLIDHIKSIRSGAFAPFLEQPWVRATFIFLSSGGGLTALQYLPWFQ